MTPENSNESNDVLQALLSENQAKKSRSTEDLREQKLAQLETRANVSDKEYASVFSNTDQKSSRKQ